MFETQPDLVPEKLRTAWTSKVGPSCRCPLGQHCAGRAMSAVLLPLREERIVVVARPRVTGMSQSHTRTVAVLGINGDI